MFCNDRTVCLVFTKYYMVIYSNGSTSPFLARGTKFHQKCYHFWLCDRNWSGVGSTEDSLPRLVILALLPVGWNQTCYAKFPKEGRTELKEQEPWHWNNQSQISFLERGAAWISRHYQVCSCLVWVCLHSLGCCENLDHQWIKTTFSSLSSWKTEVQNGCHKAKWFFLEVLAGLGVSEALGKNISLPCPALKATYTAQLADLFSQHPQSFSSGLLTGPLFCSSPYSVDAFAMDLVLPRSFQLPPHFKVSW